jgi:23S rRNA pseudouridine2457 synthase
LILSDDARLNQALLAPDNRHDRVYLAQVENIPAEQQLADLSLGVMLDGERTLPAKAELLPGEPSLPERAVPIRTRKTIPTAWVKLTLHEGKNRQVRRMTAAVGCPTLRLVRVAIGRIHLFALALQPGEWLKLSPDDVGRLFEPADEKLRIPGIHK